MAGESARRQYERIRNERQRRIRDHRNLFLALTGLSVVGGAVAAHALFGAWWVGLFLGLLPLKDVVIPSQREIAWRKGAEGEERLGRALEALPHPSRVLHDRLIPRSPANIDHVLISSTGVWTIDAKNYTGKLETRRRGRELWINGRNKAKLLDQARRQASVVAEALAAADLTTVPVRPALCFLGVEWPLLFVPERAGDVTLLSPRRLGRLTSGSAAALSGAEIERVFAVLDRALKPAVLPHTDQASRRASPEPPAPSSAARDRDAPATRNSVTVRLWTRYGKKRLYVNDADGATLGYVDLETNDVVPVEERYRQIVCDAVARYLRENWPRRWPDDGTSKPSEPV